MQLVEKRDRATLLPIITRHTLPGTTIYSDCWAAYNKVGELPNVVHHGTVNHSRHFVDPQTGVHTQAIESYWARAKSKLKRMRGTRKEILPSYLDEFMWRERRGRDGAGKYDNNEAFRNIHVCIAKNYPV